MVEKQQKKLRVLVADDSPTIHKAVQLTLSSEGYEVFFAHDGKEALEKVKRDPVDVVLADINMPEMTGYDLAYAIKVRHEIPGVSVVLMCGTFDRFDQDKYIWCKADHRIWKPFETSVFLEVIDQYGQSKPNKFESLKKGGASEMQAPKLANLPTASPTISTSPFRPTTQTNGSAKIPPPPVRRAPPRPVAPKIEPESKIETQNVGYQVQEVVQKWLKTEDAKQLVRNLVRQEIDHVLQYLEQELMDRIKQDVWEASPMNSDDVNVYHPSP